ncbi:MAG TPA: multicopper oxidase domain-containing protein, partial [Gemmatimonadales bacterium]|nr:multicopper oxidase domain-containing protein [Gemmatimonadales bacterium]
MRRLAALAILSVAGCTRPVQAPEGAGDATRRESAAPPSEIPSPLSHGEAVVGSGAVPGQRTALAPPHSSSRSHRIRMRATHVTHQVAPGVSYQAWTFDDMVPGPVVRVTVGDKVEFTLVNDSPMPHSMDFHAAEIAPNRAFINVNPGDSISFVFEPRIPGAFMYHCGTAPTAAHIANGMYGAIIVDPVKPLPEAKEFVLVQSEFYMDAPGSDGGPRRLDWNKMLSLAPDYIGFHG